LPITPIGLLVTLKAISDCTENARAKHESVKNEPRQFICPIFQHFLNVRRSNVVAKKKTFMTKADKDMSSLSIPA